MKILCLSDIHVGSTLAPWCPKTKLNQGQTVNPNAVQKWLWACWLDAAKWAATYKPQLLIVNGDLIEGNHHHAIEVMSAHEGDQVQAAVDVLQPMADLVKNIVFIRGTEVHTKELESAIAGKFGSKTISETRERAAWGIYRRTIGKSILEATHHMSVATRAWTEASAYSIHLNNRRAHSVRVGQVPAHCLLRGHRHQPGYFCDGAGMLAVTGGWQMEGRYTQKVVPDSISRPSALILDYDDMQTDTLPNIRQRIYAPTYA